jgi:hypothetical protein
MEFIQARQIEDPRLSFDISLGIKFRKTGADYIADVGVEDLPRLSTYLRKYHWKAVKRSGSGKWFKAPDSSHLNIGEPNDYGDVTLKITAVARKAVHVGAMVAVPFDGQFYLGRVKAVGLRTVVQFADGTQSTLTDAQLKPLLLITNPDVRISKRPLTRTQVLQLNAPPKGAEPSEPDAPVDDTFAVDVPFDLPRKFMDEYARVTKGNLNRPAAIRLMKAMWMNFNASRFQGKLSPPPNFGFIRDGRIMKMGAWAHFRTAPVFNRETQTVRRVYYIEFHPKSFLDDFESFAKTLLHEMCHEAVEKLDKLTYQEPNKGHGPVWAKWMRHVGLDPTKFWRDYDVATEKVMREEVQKDRDRRIERQNVKVRQELTYQDTVTKLLDGRSPLQSHLISSRTLAMVLVHDKKRTFPQLRQAMVLFQHPSSVDHWVTVLDKDIDSDVFHVAHHRDFFYPRSSDSSHVFEALLSTFERKYSIARTLAR